MLLPPPQGMPGSIHRRITGVKAKSSHRGATIMSLPLSHIQIIDLTRARSGPTCVRQLADMGARVIKVEQPDDDEGVSRHNSDFQNLHRNKRSLVLNLKDPRGIAILKRLAAKSDVLVENYRPDVKKRMGIDYE